MCHKPPLHLEERRDDVGLITLEHGPPGRTCPCPARRAEAVDGASQIIIHYSALKHLTCHLRERADIHTMLAVTPQGLKVRGVSIDTSSVRHIPRQEHFDR